MASCGARSSTALALGRAGSWLLVAIGAFSAGQAAAHRFTSPGVRHVATVEGITLSDPAVGNSYFAGETITATVRFSHSVYLNQGCWFNNGFGFVRLAVQIGAATRSFACTGNPSNNVAFRYTVQASDLDADGISIRDGALTGLINHQALNNPIDYTLQPSVEIVNSPGHRVDYRAAAISSTNPLMFVRANLDGATLVLSLTPGTAFASGVTVASFDFATTLPGLSIASVSDVSAGDTTATLTLAYNGDDFLSDQTLTVTVLSAAHNGGRDLTTGSLTVHDWTVRLDDPVLRAAAERAAGKPAGARLTWPDLRSLSVIGAGVSSLEGLQQARWLEHLDVSGNGLTDISPLAGLTELRTLLLNGNALRDLSPLSGLTGLEALALSGNGLADVSELSALSSLEQLWLDDNAITSVRALAGLRSLLYLHLGDNRIADISPLAGLLELRRLWLPGNAVEDVSPLRQLSKLVRLDLSRNRIADVWPLAQLSELSLLRLGWNRVADVSRLVGHSGLADGGALGLRGNPLGAVALSEQVPALREAGVAVVFGWPVPLFPSASDPDRSGVVRVLNRSDEDGVVLVEAVDEAGQRFGPATLSVAAGAAASFDSADLENGNPAKGLMDGVGSPSRGSWRLGLWSVLDIEALAYVSTPDGFLTAAHGELPRAGESLAAFVFNPASNRAQRSSLRVHNPGVASANVLVWGVDDAGRGRLATGFAAPAGATLVTARELESSRGAAGSGLGDGAGKWRLRVSAPWPLSASAWLESPTGHVSNLSVSPLLGAGAAAEPLRLPLFPSTSNPAGREGFARVENLTAQEGWAEVVAVDDAGVRAGPVRLRLSPRATMHFNSTDLENGNADKGLSAGVGAPTQGAWRLELRSALALAAGAYARHADGFVTSLHEMAPAAEGTARVAVFEPASNDGPRSLLRLANDGAVPAVATITGVDDAGAAGAAPVSVTVPAGEAMTITATQLEEGGEMLEGSLGDGAGQWRLTVEFDNPLTVMSLMESAAGHLSNLSAVARP